MQNNLYVIKKVFDLTASQEKEHAEVFLRYALICISTINMHLLEKFMHQTAEII